MDRVGADLGINLDELYTTGRRHLLDISGCFAAEHNVLANTDGVMRAFQREGVDRGGVSASVPGSVYPVWMAVFQEYTRMVGETVDNVQATGEALVRVADAYAATDTAAGEEMRRRVHKSGLGW